MTRPALVIGGYGTFGAHVCHELTRRNIPVRVAGRDPTRAGRLARALGGDATALAVDVTDPASCRRALEDRPVVVQCAGSFGDFTSLLAETCLEFETDYVDLCDDRAHFARLRALDPAFCERGRTAILGASSLPGISGALLHTLLSPDGPPIEGIRTILFIGNRNPKGAAALASFLDSLGKSIPAPQENLRGLTSTEPVDLPPPFGRRPVAPIESPGYDLFAEQFSPRWIRVQVGFELPLALRFFCVLGRLRFQPGPLIRRLLILLGALTRPFGHSGGAVQTELHLAGGAIRRAAVSTPTDGQRMAAYPCALAAAALARGEITTPGAGPLDRFLDPHHLLDELTRAGFEIHRSD